MFISFNNSLNENRPVEIYMNHPFAPLRQGLKAFYQSSFAQGRHRLDV